MTNQLPPEFTEEKLKKVAGDVKYEIIMLVSCAEKIAEISKQLSELTIAKNAYLESFLIHARNMRDFFYQDERKQDDVLATDYIPNWSNRPEKDEYWEMTKVKLNKLVPHITLSRADLTQNKDWNIPLMCSELLKVWKVFLENLSKHSKEKSDWFEKPK